MHIPDADLRAAGARLRATIVETQGGDVLGYLLAVGLVTRADLVAWEREDLRRFAARMRREEVRQ